MQQNGASQRPNGHRRSILDLAPLELECMNALWPLGQATVREIQDVVSASRPRAYTTILTIMDRLAHKGVVARVKSGRAWVYRGNFSAEQARESAISQVVRHFFGGSAEALRAHLAGHRAEIAPVSPAAQDAAARKPRPAARSGAPPPEGSNIDESLL